MRRAPLPLIYSCSGCSSAAQLANALAVRLDREGVAQMSCISGVGGGVEPLVHLARSGRPVIAVDGCQLRCTITCLSKAGVTPTEAVVLADSGVRKRQHQDFDPRDFDSTLPSLRELCLRSEGSVDRRRKPGNNGPPAED